MERNTIYLCLAHMSEEGYEQKYVKEAFDTNWVAAYINKWDFSWPETFRKYFADDPDALKLLLKRYG